MLPGRTAASKAALATAGAGAAAAAIQTGLYIPSEESVLLLAFVLTVRGLQVAVGDRLAAWTAGQYERFYAGLAAMRSAAESDVSSALARLRSYADAADAAGALFALRRETAQMEAQLAFVQTKNARLDALRRSLEDAVRAAAERRRNAAAERAEALLRAVLERLADADVQKRVLKDAIAALSRARPSS